MCGCVVNGSNAHVHQISNFVFQMILSLMLCVCSVRGRALGCVASAASSERSEVVSALRMCISTQTASDPLVAGEKGLTHSFF